MVDPFSILGLTSLVAQVTTFGTECRQRYRIYRQHDVKLREDLIKVDVCWSQAESHLSGIACLAKLEHIKEEDIPSVSILVQTFYNKLITVDREIEGIIKPFFGLRKIRYVFGYKGLNGLIEELEKWCVRLDHDHVKRHLTYEAEGEVRALVNGARSAVRDFLYRPHRVLMAESNDHGPTFLSRPESRPLLDAAPSLQALGPSLPHALHDYDFDLNAGRSRLHPIRILSGLVRIFRRSKAA